MRSLWSAIIRYNGGVMCRLLVIVCLGEQSGRASLGCGSGPIRSADSLVAEDTNDNNSKQEGNDVNWVEALVLMAAPLLPLSSSLPLPSSSASMATVSPSTAITSVTPHTLSSWINDDTALIIDIRPLAPYSNARIPSSLSLSVPSTLLKRPSFPVNRIAEMLSSPQARARFQAWPRASRILVYDADTNAILDSSNINGLLRKFINGGFTGQLAWLQGGFQAVWREQRELIDATPLMPEAEMGEADDQPPTLLCPRRLPLAAFSSCSTTAASPLQQRRAPMLSAMSVSASSNMTAVPMPMSMSLSLPIPQCSAFSPQKKAYNPFYDTVRQNRELPQGITERIPLRLPQRVRRRIYDLPFPWLQRIARRAALAPKALHSAIANVPFGDSSSSEIEEGESGNDSDVAGASTSMDALVAEGAEELAKQFYRIELAEQKRIMGALDRHSRESGKVILAGESCATAEGRFPFSIAAGVEKGAKNRCVPFFLLPFAEVAILTACQISRYLAL